MTKETQPTAAAMRAAWAINNRVFLVGEPRRMNAVEEEYAAIIDAEIRPLVEALEPFARFVRQYDKRPMHSDMKRALAALNHAQGNTP